MMRKFVINSNVKREYNIKEMWITNAEKKKIIHSENMNKFS